MDHQPLRRKYGSAHHPILVAKCALSRPADDVETRTPRHWKDAASRKIHLVAIESRFCFSLWKVNQRIITYVRPLSSNNPGRRARQALPGCGCDRISSEITLASRTITGLTQATPPPRPPEA